jgi:hypothetical protein
MDFLSTGATASIQLILGVGRLHIPKRRYHGFGKAAERLERLRKLIGHACQRGIARWLNWEVEPFPTYHKIFRNRDRMTWSRKITAPLGQV